MEILKLNKDISVMGFQVTTFPNGIGEAFDDLVSRIPGGFNRAYYGISYMAPDSEILYQAAAAVLDKSEPSNLNLEGYTIEHGDYLAVTLRDWRKNLDKIKEIFHEITRDQRAKHSPCIEWYKDDDEMVCMVRINNP